MNRKESNGKRLLCTSRMLTAIIVLSVFIAGIGIVPASAQVATVTRDLPDSSVKTTETFAVTLTQSGFMMDTGMVWEVLPEGFEYVDGSYSGGAPEWVNYDPATRTLRLAFWAEYEIAYSVKASSYPQTAVFSGTYKAIVGDPHNETGDVTGDTVVVVEEEGDTTPPAAITDLATSNPTTSTINLTWTAPGDDGTTRTAATYDIRYLAGTTPITDANWAAATQCTGEPTPQAAGSSETFTVTGLAADTDYYFAIKTMDEVPLWSPVSNSPSGTTLVSPDTTPPVITNVTSSAITTNSATITWDTDEIADSLVKYGIASGVYTVEEYNAADVTAHSIGLAGLAEDTIYYYVVNSTDPSGNSAESAEYDFTTLAVPDLIVTAITPNCGYLFANESNEICTVIKNNGTADAGAFNVSFDIDGFGGEVRVISGLAMGASEEVTVTDPAERNAGDSVTITVTADCNGEVNELDETNNESSIIETVVNNGYKGKRYTGGENITTLQTHTLNGSVLYSVGDSYYLSGATTSWTQYIANWAASDLPVPGDATIEKARLYVVYTWDKVQGMPDNVSLKFNNNPKTRDAFYTDRKGYDGYDYPYGMLAYDVAGDFNIGSINTAVLENLNPVAGNPSIRGMFLVVIYADDSEPQRTIIMNEGFDLLYGGSAKCTTPEEATAFAPFAGAIGDIGNKSARLITVAPGAGDPNEGELIFNGHTWTDVWNFAGATQIGIDDRDVTAYLQGENNEAGFQSSEDWMEASNAVLVVETKPEDSEAPVVTNANASPSIIPDDTDGVPLWGENSTLNVTVTDESTITSVTINLSAIGGSAVQAMTNTGGDVWAVSTNASNETAGWNGTAYVPHQLQVNATDEYENSNTSVSIELTVMKNGDVQPYDGDGEVDFTHDALYLVRHTKGVPGYVDIRDNIADVTGDGEVDFMHDALYLVRHTKGVPGYEILH